MTRGIVIAAVRSGAGKTTVALGLMRAFARRGVGVQPFKCGPDYIDPAFHRVATGRASYNLDGWAMAAGTLNRLVDEHGADLAIAEGVMGLFDGVAGRGATADVAALLGWPVVLVLDVKGQTETAAAIAAGCAAYRSDIAIAGVILNRVAGARHLSLIAPAFERIGVKLFGALTNDPRLSLPERHLGLVQAGETVDVERQLDLLADVLQETVDLDAVAASAGPSKAGSVTNCDGFFDPPGQRVALARDEAFSFMYPHVVEHWRARGAEMLPFSPLRDEAPAVDADAVWLPGGYPELHAGTLASASRFKEGLRALADRGVRIHGECGGYMVLGQGLADAEGKRHAMTGLLAVETSFARPSLHLGYRTARLDADCALGAAGTEILGHEFHYASVLAVGDDRLVECRDASNAVVAEAGARRGSVSGTFFHAISKRPS
jgi:cobyrinic acid a,c-diamide synthase